MNGEERHSASGQGGGAVPAASPPSTADLFAEAVRHHQAGKLNEAEALYRQVLTINPKHARSLHRLGLIASQAGREAIAADFIGQAIALKPRNPYFHYSLGNVLKNRGRLAEAAESYGRALALKPDFAEAHCDLGNILQAQGKFAEAAESYRRALELRPDYVEVHNNLGVVLLEQGNFPEAIESCRRALALKPDFVEAHNNLGNALQAQGKLAEAVECYKRALALKPDAPLEHSNLATALLRHGQFEEGWLEYEWRLKLKKADSPANPLARTFSRPLWDGKNLRGTLLLYAEQGYGDTIQFCRFAPLAGQRTRIVLAVQRKLIRLLSSLPDVAAIISDGDRLPPFDAHCSLLTAHCSLLTAHCSLLTAHCSLLTAHCSLLTAHCSLLTAHCSLLTAHCSLLTAHCSLLTAHCSLLTAHCSLLTAHCSLLTAHCSLLSLPHILGTRLETIPGEVPYLRADPERTAFWRRRLDTLDGLRVGLVWAGSSTNRHRSISLDSLASLGSIKGVSFVSLQKYQDGREKPVPCEELRLHDWTDELDDFAETAALIDGLDLVITVDTSVVHLAGALSKKVWLLNRFNADWRWLLDRDDSPWYPTLRQFRQKSFGDWTSVIRNVREALLTQAKSHER